MSTPAFTADCGHLIPALPDGHCGGTGYGQYPDGRRFCYACCALELQESMRNTGRAILYAVDSQASAGRALTIQDWAGKLNFPAYNITRSHGYGFGTRYEIVTGRFIGPDGKLWCFRNAGDNQIARCKRLKDAR